MYATKKKIDEKKMKEHMDSIEQYMFSSFRYDIIETTKPPKAVNFGIQSAKSNFGERRPIFHGSELIVVGNNHGAQLVYRNPIKRIISSIFRKTLPF